MDQTLIIGLLAATLRIATPILLAGLGEVFAERAGVLNLGIEGIMLMGAILGFIAAYLSGSLWVGLIAAMVVGLLAGLIGGVVAGILSIPLHAVTAGFMRQIMERIIANNPDFPPEARDALERFGMASGAGLVISALFNIVISTVFGLLGGLLGVAIFKKKDLPPPPPPGTIDVPSAPAQ